MAISIVINYYENLPALDFFVENFARISQKSPGSFELVLVDDCSPTPVMASAFGSLNNVRAFRIKENVPWNMPAARNVGALEARGNVMLMCDIDHILEYDEVDRFLRDAESLPLGVRMTPNRKRPADGDQPSDLKPNINCFLIRRQDFFRVGGYEELFSGHYGFEDKYFRYCCRWAGVEDQPAGFRLSVMKGGATKGLDRDTSRNGAIFEALHSTRIHRAERVLSYEYEKIF